MFYIAESIVTSKKKKIAGGHGNQRLGAEGFREGHTEKLGKRKYLF